MKIAMKLWREWYIELEELEYVDIWVGKTPLPSLTSVLLTYSR